MAAFIYRWPLGADLVTTLGTDLVTTLGADLVTTFGADLVTTLGADLVTTLGANLVTTLGRWTSGCLGGKREAKLLSSPPRDFKGADSFKYLQKETTLSRHEKSTNQTVK